MPSGSPTDPYPRAATVGIHLCCELLVTYSSVAVDCEERAVELSGTGTRTLAAAGLEGSFIIPFRAYSGQVWPTGTWCDNKGSRVARRAQNADGRAHDRLVEVANYLL